MPRAVSDDRLGGSVPEILHCQPTPSVHILTAKWLTMESAIASSGTVVVLTGIVPLRRLKRPSTKASIGCDRMFAWSVPLMRVESNS